MSRLYLLVAAVGAAALLAAASAGHAAVSDGDDSRSGADMAGARAAFDRDDDRLVHVIRFYEPISARTFRNAIAEHGPPGSVCVNVWTTRTPWEASPNHEVCVTGDRDGRGLAASVSRIGTRGSVRRTGRASAELTSPRRLVVRFDPDLISRPRSYRWSAQATTFERGCTRRGCKDFAPRRGRSRRIELG